MIRSWVVVLCAGCAAVVADSGPRLGQVDPAVEESSGLARSEAHPGVFWTHGDSGGGAELFAISTNGRLLGRVAVRGAKAVDWEAITADGQGHLWIGDHGNNDNDRRDLTLYRVPEPKPGDAEVTVDQVVRFSMPEQTDWPMKGRKNFDLESLFFADGTAWVLTKHRSDLDTVLYRFPTLEGEVVLERISKFTLGGDPDNFGGKATSADLSADGRYLAVLSYHAVFVFERPEQGHDWLSRPVARVDLNQDITGQCEGIAWDGWSLVFTNEDRTLFRVDDPFHAPEGRFPGGGGR